MNSADSWRSVPLALQRGMIFVCAADAETPPVAVGPLLNSAVLHALHLGTVHRRGSMPPWASRPDWLLSASLTLPTAALDEARALAIPVVLSADLLQASADAVVTAWIACGADDQTASFSASASSADPPPSGIS